MSHAAAASSIRSRLNAQWNTTSIAWPNQDFSPTVGTAYVRPTIRFNSAGQFTLGPDGIKRVSGALEVEVFVPSNSPTGTAWTYADTIGALFQRKTISDVRFWDYNAEVAELPEGEPWFRLMVEVPFYYDDEPAETDELASYPVRNVTQSAHGFAVGDWVYVDLGSGAWAKAQADDAATVSWPAVVTNVQDTERFQVTLPNGKANIPSHGLGSQGTKVYLSQSTAGAATTTEPASGLVQQVGKIWDADHIEVMDLPISNVS